MENNNKIFSFNLYTKENQFLMFSFACDSPYTELVLIPTITFERSLKNEYTEIKNAHGIMFKWLNIGLGVSIINTKH